MVKAASRPEGGLVVSAIAPESPLRTISRANGLAGVFQAVPGDVITHVNGRPVNDEASCDEILSLDSGEVFLTIIDSAGGSEERWVCRPALVRRALLIGLTFPSSAGALVNSIDPQSPTKRLRAADGSTASLALGDRILQINGLAADSSEACHQALNGFGGEATLSIVRAGTGAAEKWTCSTADVRLPEKTVARRTAWILLVGQTDDPRLGKLIPMSLQSLQEVFRTMIAPDRLRLRILDGADCVGERILASIRALPVAEDDALVVYYLGHGAYDPAAPANDPTGGHYFDLASGPFARRVLRREIEARSARLKVLISDACNVPGGAIEELRPVYSALAQPTVGLTPTEKLLFNFRGIVDLQAASRDQSSWYGAPYGGWFTHSLVLLLPMRDDWNVFLANLKTNSNDFFVARKIQLALNHDGVDAAARQALSQQTAMTPQVYAADLVADVAAADANDKTERMILVTTPHFLPK